MQKTPQAVKRAGIYARHSTDKQATSTTDQIARCQVYCASRGYIVTGIYTDEAISGRIRQRPGIQRLLLSAQENVFDVLVTEDLSRVSRKIGQMADTFDLLQYLGISIETVGNGTVSQVDVGLRGTMNALYLTDLADKTRRGMKAAVQRGSLPGGQTYGYRIVRKIGEDGELERGHREIVPEEAEVIRRIYQDYLAGETLSGICEVLNGLAIPSPGGKKWYPSTLIGTASRQSGILRNRLYVGEVVFNRQEWRTHPETGERMAMLRSEAEWITAPAPDLAIISQEVFDAVQVEIAARSRARNDVVRIRKQTKVECHAAEVAEIHRQWRERQEKALTNAMLFFSGRLHCGWSGKKMTALRKGKYSCRTPNCPVCSATMDEFLAPATLALYEISPQPILAHYTDPIYDEKRQAIEARINKAEDDTAQARKEISEMLSILGTGAKVAEIRSFLAEKEAAVRHHHMQRSVAVRDLRALSPTTGQAKAAVSTVHKLADRLKANFMDYQPNIKLRHCIEKVALSLSETGGYTATVEWDIPAVMKLSRTDKS
ncbi:recombinase family protein [Novispirillum itersonii]|uniref:DNA invertase Pin-like site-specific DNA recombinase n=1 Tax=Novispirillum itersonii TaxID=189 RepID=A0A7W9ZLG6_NOVIT|nr:recombinase family protein [Novispirillum itersonii]MBB6212409.1 DNA invertase Pin-like site-specific DNA recombinase [Novispirillum itersonii]